MTKLRGKAKLEELLESEGEALLRAAIERGKAGDVSALRLAIERVWPTERARDTDRSSGGEWRRRSAERGRPHRCGCG